MLYTIGHTNHELEVFLGLLRKYNITCLIDVRSKPYAKFTNQFNKEELNKFLTSNNIKYSHMGKYFGARQNDRSLYTSGGYLDFEKMRESEDFKTGMNNVIKGLDQDNNIVLMCTEKDPIDCHRAIMVARGFELNGIEVNHILPNGELMSQAELNNRLVNMYNQLTLFQDDSNKTEEEIIVDAYRKRNAEIGYHKVDKEDEE